MRTTLYVISDLHLGGAPARDGRAGFQICQPRTQQQLARFIDGLPGRRADHDVRLVIAGDFVDFLAEEPFEAFTTDPEQAQRKLASIFETTAQVWQALQRFVREREGAVTVMLGNHDIELSLPAVRHALLRHIGPGRVDFVYDNEAFTLGGVLVEHGNRFDEWNAVPHGALRRVRSQQSRRRTAKPDFPALPGSRLVVDVMNPLKQKHPFVDLLKPEDAAALPILAALGATSLRDAWRFSQRYRQSWAVDFDEEREPLDAEYISANDSNDQRLFDLAEDIAHGGDASQVGALSKLVAGEALFRALQGLLDKHRAAFDVEHEDAKYLAPARASARAGFQVVVYGHTHLAKRVPLGAAADPLPVYLNTGTWADLMSVPKAVWGGDPDQARTALRAFVADLEHNRLEAWRRSAPTFAQVELDGEHVTSADVFFVGDERPERVTTDGLARRLAGGPLDA
jgi:UDP-2,3-diacylglucosamine pyrophosphatase LpxH